MPFGLNVLAFADLADIIKASVFPVLPAVGLLMTYAAIDGLNALSKKEHDERIRHGGFDKYYMRFLVFYGYSVIALGVGYAAYLIVVEPGHQKLKGVFPLASMLGFLYLIYGNTHLLTLDVKSRVFVVSLLCFLPTAAFHRGNEDGERILRLEGDVWDVKPKEPCPGGATDLVLLARLSNKYLTMSRANKSICVIHDGNVQLARSR